MSASYPDHDLRWAHLSSARWFAAKGRDATLTAIHPLGRLTPPGDFPTLGLEIAEVAIPGGPTEYYLLTLLWRRLDGVGDPTAAPVLGTEWSETYGEVTVHDASLDPAGQRLLLQWLLRAGALSAGGDAVRAEVAAALPPELTAELPPRRFGGEQSNTSVLYGDVALLKLFRRLEVGANLDIEVHRELARTGAVVDLYGSAHAVWSSASGARLSADVAMLVQQLREARDGWELAVAAASSGADFTGHAADLGRALAEVHSALAERFGTASVEGAPLAERMVGRLTDTAAEVPALQPLVDRLRDRFAVLGRSRVTVQRVHGDFHLGQTLYAAADADNLARSAGSAGASGPAAAQGAAAAHGADPAEEGAGPAKAWYIIDFEGEPLKTLAQRREPDTRWRDIAGMVRSIDYAGAAAGAAGRTPEQAEAWVRETTAAFLAGYAGPGSAEEADAAELVPDADLIEAYVADKAIYEVLYEARNRPDWLHIPLDALRRLTTDPFTIGGHTMTDNFFGDIHGWDFEGFHTGGDTEAWKRLGAHLVTVTDESGTEISGTRFTVWAPNAKEVRVFGDFCDWDGDAHPMRLIPHTGVWGIFLPGVGAGAVYKFKVRGADDRWIDRADPYARYAEQPPATASVVIADSDYEWNDDAWLEHRRNSKLYQEPMAIYEVHLGGWRRGKSYQDLATELVEYVSWQGYTHVEFMPVAQHPYEPSWGYQVTGYFAPQSAWGTPDELRYLIDKLHEAGIGVLLDWVPGHFPKDEWALGRFDGTALYEHADPRQGEQPDWGTYVFNFGRNEVKSFLVSNALYWIQEFHFDGLRIDAVASMLYLDYSRGDNWVPNIYGGRENLEAIDLLRYVNKHLYERQPGVVLIAEESTSFPGITKPVHHGGLGFGFKWNMGWMNDSLGYLSLDPIYRQYHHNEMTFAMVYSFSENFILPISHDEVVHGKGAMVTKIPGDDWQKFATLRAFYAFMWSHPGKQLLFMGSEFGQRSEFNESAGLEWWVSDLWGHRGVQLLMRRLNEVYRHVPALWKLDTDPAGFRWIDADDAGGNVFSYLRNDGAGDQVAVVVNFSPAPREDYRIGLPTEGVWTEILNTDLPEFNGTGGYVNHQVVATEIPSNHLPASASVLVPPLGAVWLRFDPHGVRDDQSTN